MSLAHSLWGKVKWLRRSSTLRLSLLISAIFVAGFAIAILVAVDIAEDANEARVDASLAALAATTTLSEDGGDSPTMIYRSAGDQRALPNPFRRAVDRGGGTVNLNSSLLRSEVWRVFVGADSGGTPVLIAVPMDDSEEAQELLAQILWATAAILLGLTLAIGGVAGVLSQRRLARIDATLGRLAEGDLTARTGQRRARDDLDDIARQLDLTAAELERLVTQTRHLSASIAHDLRTPLARLRAQLEMLPEGEERGAAMEEASRLSGIFDTIMRVARIEATQGQEGFETVSLSALVTDLGETFAPVVEDAEKTLVVEAASPVSIQADRQMLVQALANLIQNALVHGGDEITLFARGATIGVADTGGGVDPEQFDEIIKPMVRLDAARTRDGSGLGLALVRAVADRHGAMLELEKHQPQGLRVRLNFAKL